MSVISRISAALRRTPAGETKPVTGGDRAAPLPPEGKPPARFSQFSSAKVGRGENAPGRPPRGEPNGPLVAGHRGRLSDRVHKPADGPAPAMARLASAQVEQADRVETAVLEPGGTLGHVHQQVARKVGGAPGMPEPARAQAKQADPVETAVLQPGATLIRVRQQVSRKVAGAPGMTEARPRAETDNALMQELLALLDAQSGRSPSGG